MYCAFLAIGKQLVRIVDHSNVRMTRLSGHQCDRGRRRGVSLEGGPLDSVAIWIGFRVLVI